MSKNLFIRIFSSILLFILSLYLIIKGNIFFNIFIILLLMISSLEWHKMSYKRFYYLPGLLFLIISFYTAYLIRNDFNVFYFLMIFFICILTDIGGYIFGKIIKGPKLTKISPNKTYSGALGGLLLSLLGSWIFYNWSIDILIKPNLTISNLFIFSIFISIISQIGDLAVSLFKRLSNLKDTGNIIPGHGGILDRIDGMIFAFPISFLLNIF